MMEEGSRVILRLKKIRQAVIASPEPILWYSRMRTEFEMLLLEIMIRDKEGVNFYLFYTPDIKLREIWKRLREISIELGLRMLEESSDVNRIDIVKRL
ncbi:hypothetical protein DPMN_037572 [Dreissena polymorpha]|uniref:Uncharacterized protein n=1 Tax=Dreissena polymorpha TaxID=45954 RepID=A0A9D4MDT6_DREPO|nr:hypothetical protein DPMN_037572 [Dreissena polymorpha]